MMTSPAKVETLVSVAQRASAAGHGQKTAVYQEAAKALGMSLQTLHRKLGELTVRPPRKRRADAGQVALSRPEALAISAALMEAYRKNNKGLLSISQALEMLRANNIVKAERVDPSTGEICQLGEAAILRALRLYKLHPEQLMQKLPTQSLASRHPNHVWEIDASLCVLVYLPTGLSIQVMKHDEIYKNKPGNFAKIEKDTVWRYVITDHASGWVFVHYVFGGETGKNLCESFIRAIQKRGINDPVHGLPAIVMLDPGSANTGALFKNLCAALNIHVQINKPGQPWAKGQVEQAQNLVETSFESRLAFVKISAITELNEQAAKWMRWFNSTHIHTRHGKTRYACWLLITPEQLRNAPPVAVCQELATSAPESHPVTTNLWVNFKGAQWDVSKLPGVIVGERLMMCRNPWADDTINIITYDGEGNTVYHLANLVTESGPFGFADGAPVIGESYKGTHKTVAQHNREEIELVATDSATPDEAAAKRKQRTKGNFVPFGGKIDPWKVIDETPDLSYLPRAGQASNVQAPTVQYDIWPITKVLLHLKTTGLQITPERRACVEQWFPHGVPENAIAGLKERLLTEETTPAAPAAKFKLVS